MLKVTGINKALASDKHFRDSELTVNLLSQFFLLPVVIFSFPKIISSATRPPIATSSLARSWDFDQLSSSFSGNWATFKRKFVYIQRVLQFGFSSAVFHAQISVSVKHIRSTKSLTAWERDETWWLRER